MDNSKKEIKYIKIFFRGLAITILIIGMFFSFLIAKLNDAPGFVLFGTAAVLGVSFLLFGISEIIIQLKKNNELLSTISEKISK